MPLARRHVSRSAPLSDDADHRASEDFPSSAIGRVPFSGSAVMGVFLRCRRLALVPFAFGLLAITILTPGLAPGEDRPPVDSPVWVGTGSCSALACHGGRREPL